MKRREKEGLLTRGGESVRKGVCQEGRIDLMYEARRGCLCDPECPYLYLCPGAAAGQLVDGSVTYDVTYDRGTVLSQAPPRRATRL